MAGRNSQVSRFYAILGILEGAPQGLSVAEICARLEGRAHEVGKRTVYRDLEALSKAGFPVYEEGLNDANAQRWKLNKATRIADYLVLSIRELVALYLARSVLAPLRDTFFFEDLNRAFEKIDDKLGAKARDFLTELSEGFAFEPGPRWGLGLDPDVVETVRAACAERNVLKVDYTSAYSGERRVRRLGPHFLYFAKGALYLVAEDLDAKRVKVYSLPRMASAEIEDVSYEAEAIDPEPFFSGAFGIYQGTMPVPVHVRFVARIAPFVRERRWHSSQRVIARADGGLDLHLEVGLSPELEQWILGFGPDVQVLSPADLSRAVGDKAEAVARIYRSKKDVA